jgi:hypothetical protein
MPVDPALRNMPPPVCAWLLLMRVSLIVRLKVWLGELAAYMPPPSLPLEKQQ